MLKESSKLYSIVIQRGNVGKYNKMGFDCAVGDIVSASIENLIESGSTLKIDLVCDVCSKEFKRQARQIKERSAGDSYCNICSNRVLRLKDQSLVHLGPKERRDKADLEKYGQIGLSKKEKTKLTCNERYGVDNPWAADSVKAKIAQTNLDRYGVENPFQSVEVKEKIKQTNLERRGVENPWQCEEVIKKVKETKLERYGDENYNNREKSKLTNLEQYGVEHIFQREDIKEIIRIANKEYVESDEFFEFRRQLREEKLWGEYRVDTTEWENYKYLVWMYTRRNDLSVLENYDKRGLAGVEDGYQLDHKVSIKYGFDNNVCPSVIGNINNIEFIPWEENLSKSVRCSISLEELLQQ